MRAKRPRVRAPRGTAKERAMEQASLKAVREYRMKNYNGQIVVLRAAEQPWWVRWESCDWALGWDKYALQVQIKGIDGAHSTVLESRRATPLAEVLRACLQGE